VYNLRDIEKFSTKAGIGKKKKKKKKMDIVGYE